MLIDFSVKNFLSFKEMVSLSMVAANIKENDEMDKNVIFLDHKIEANTIKKLEEKRINTGNLEELKYRFFTKEQLLDELKKLDYTEKETDIIVKSSELSKGRKLRLLKTAVIYGANASGKSNFMRALAFFINFIAKCIEKMNMCKYLDGKQFRLSTETYNKPGYFQIIFLLKGVNYRYGFEVDKTGIHSEWLFYTPKTKEIKLFTRKKNEFNIETNFKEGRNCIERTREDTLFLTTVMRFNGKTATRVYNNLLEQFIILSGLSVSCGPLTIEMLKQKEEKQKILNFIKMADLYIEDLEVKEELITNEKIKEIFLQKRKLKDDDRDLLLLENKLYSIHKKYDNNGSFVEFEKFDFLLESDGTDKILDVSYPIIIALLEGKTLLIDELDARLHPLITQKIIDLFHTYRNKNAQLIFASHDACLLKKENFRRDQIWFMEKNDYEATDLYSLVEYKFDNKAVRNDATYDKNYIKGRYGAIPFVGTFDYFYEVMYGCLESKKEISTKN